jgi:hypothetical protein
MKSVTTEKHSHYGMRYKLSHSDSDPKYPARSKRCLGSKVLKQLAYHEQITDPGNQTKYCQVVNADKGARAATQGVLVAVTYRKQHDLSL